MFRNLKLFNEWYARLNEQDRGLFAQYLAIRRGEGADWPTILKELIAHLPDILAFIQAIVSLFNHPAAVLVALVLAANGAFAQAAPPPARVTAPPVAKVSRCCDCCTCPDGACRCAFPGECVYAAAYRVSLRDGKPLVVFVGQAERAVVGCRTCAVPAFPGATGPCVVVGIPDGTGAMDRSDVPGVAEVERIRATAVRGCESGFCRRKAR